MEIKCSPNWRSNRTKSSTVLSTEKKTDKRPKYYANHPALVLFLIAPTQLCSWLFSSSCLFFSCIFKFYTHQCQFYCTSEKVNCLCRFYDDDDWWLSRQKCTVLTDSYEKLIWMLFDVSPFYCFLFFFCHCHFCTLLRITCNTCVLCRGFPLLLVVVFFPTAFDSNNVTNAVSCYLASKCYACGILKRIWC